MQTKFNTGDPVLVPATIRSARTGDAGVTYEVDVDGWAIPEAYIQPDAMALGASLKALAEAMPRRGRV